jgi:site-specific recombinase XerD
LITLPKGTELEEARRYEPMVRRRKERLPDLHAATVANLFPDYLKWYGIRRAAGTVRDITQTWEHSLKPIMGGCPIRDVGNEQLAFYQQSRAGKVKNRTINKELDYFSGFLKWCRREKKIDVDRIEYEKLPCKRPLPVILSPEEVARIMESAESEPFYLAFFLCLYALGFRLKETRFLKLEDFDFNNRAVKVLQKGGTEKILPLTDRVVEAVKDLSELWPMEPGEYLFAMKRTGRPVTDIRDPIARICKRAGVTKGVHAHTFRHSIAGHLMTADINQRVIQKYLGHSQISSTSFYTNVSLGNLRNAQDMVLVSTGNSGLSLRGRREMPANTESAVDS